jgi:hypothetical protein
MPAALAATKLTQVQPTAEELEAARQLKADSSDKKKRSVDSGFREYLKRNPDPNASASDELKERALLNFMVLQLRSKGGKKTIGATHSVAKTDCRIAEKHWWNEFQMDGKLGPTVGKHWRDSGLIQRKCCPVTQSDKPEHCIWGVPKLWESLTESDYKALRLETEREANQGDSEAMTEFANLNKNSIEGGDSAAAAAAVKTPKELEAELMLDVKSQPSHYLRKYQDLKQPLNVLARTTSPYKPSKFPCKRLPKYIVRAL